MAHSHRRIIVPPSSPSTPMQLQPPSLPPSQTLYSEQDPPPWRMRNFPSPDATEPPYHSSDQDTARRSPTTASESADPIIHAVHHAGWNRRPFHTCLHVPPIPQLSSLSTCGNDLAWFLSSSLVYPSLIFRPSPVPLLNLLLLLTPSSCWVGSSQGQLK